jgi:hypothetical protein
MRWEGHEAGLGKKRNMPRLLVEKPKGRTTRKTKP